MTNEEIQEIVAKADAEYDRLKDRVHEQYDEIERLNNKIDKAIEKIESVRIYGLRSGKTLIVILLNEVLDILKGSDKK